MIGKIVVSGISILLVVGIVFGVIAAVGHNTDKPETLTPQAKAVRFICEPTSYKDVCTKSLANVKSDDPKDLIKAIVVATQVAMKKAYNFTADTLVQYNNGTANAKAELEYCKMMMDFGIDDLQTFLEGMGNDVRNLTDGFYDFRQLLINVWVYQSNCYEEIWDEELRKTMESGTLDARKLSSNAVDVIAELNKVLASFGLQFNVSTYESFSSSRRLIDVGRDGYPIWFSTADRKLLARAGALNLIPNVVVAQDGSGQFNTINAALAAYNPQKGAPAQGRYVIYVKEGIYNEEVVVQKHQINVFIYGDGPRKTIIAGNKSAFGKEYDTFQTGTVKVFGNGFMAKRIGIQNTAGPAGHQAVALMIQADFTAVFNCRIDGFQDSLWANQGRQFYRNCVISGTVDFIFGMSTTLIQNSLIIVRKGADGQQNTITADGNEKGLKVDLGIVIQKCRIVPDMKLAADKLKVKSYLGRPWKPFSTTVIRDSEIGDFLDPAGWLIWQGKNHHETCFAAEYNNRGPGSITDRRVNWKGFKVITNPMEVSHFTADQWLQAGKWLRQTGVPFTN